VEHEAVELVEVGGDGPALRVVEVAAQLGDHLAGRQQALAAQLDLPRVGREPRAAQREQQLVEQHHHQLPGVAEASSASR
jgi:hypothetical protein